MIMKRAAQQKENDDNSAGGLRKLMGLFDNVIRNSDRDDRTFVSSIVLILGLTLLNLGIE